jgi:tryptophan-rich sensory protein
MSAQAMGILVLVVVMLVTGSVNTLSKVASLHFLPFN